MRELLEELVGLSGTNYSNDELLGMVAGELKQARHRLLLNDISMSKLRDQNIRLMHACGINSYPAE